MKTKISILSCLIVICMVCSVMPCFAADSVISDLKKSMIGNFMQISGRIENKPGAEVLLRIEYPTVQLLENTTDMTSTVAFFGQQKADSNGKFSFTVRLDYNENPYKLRIGVMGDDADYSEDFICYGGNYRIIARDAINKQKTEGTNISIMDEISKYYENLYLDSTLYDQYIRDNKDIYELGKVLIKSSTLGDVSELSKQLEDAVIIASFKLSATDEELISLFDKYSGYTDIIESSAYSTMLSIGDLKHTILESFKNAQYYTAEDAGKAFSYNVISLALKNAVGAEAVKKILTDNSGTLGIDMNNYKFTNEQFNSIAGIEIMDLVDVKTALDNIKNGSGSSSQTNESGNKNSSPSGGGGGSGVVVTKPVLENQSTEENKNDKYPFLDMDNHGWAKESVLALYNKGIIKGESNDVFAPERDITREEFLKIIVDSFSDDSQQGAEIQFSDVNKTDWFYPYISKGVAFGIVSGKDDGTFGVGEPITRQDMAVMLFRSIEYFHPNVTIKGFLAEKFTDFNLISEYALDAVAFVGHSGISIGMGDGNFSPLETTTRAQIAVIVFRAIQYVENIE